MFDRKYVFWLKLRKLCKGGGKVNYGLSDQVRAAAKVKYVVRAASEGKRPFSIPVKEVLRELEGDGFPPNHVRQICTAITSGKFLRENGIEIQSIEGPPSKTSTTVVVHYRFAQGEEQAPDRTGAGGGNPAGASKEAPEEWAHRVTGKIRGILKDELAEYGGGEAFLRWVRGYDDEDAA